MFGNRRALPWSHKHYNATQLHLMLLKNNLRLKIKTNLRILRLSKKIGILLAFTQVFTKDLNEEQVA